MKINDLDSDEIVLRELGQRIAQYRLNLDKTQKSLAKEAGISNRTLVRMEHGESVQTTNLIRVLRVLKLMSNLESLIPQPAVSPVEQLKLQGKQRQRASSKSPTGNPEVSWTWADEE